MRRYLLPLFARFVNLATRLIDALCGFLFLPPLGTRLLQWLLPLEERAVLRAAYKATGLRDHGEGTFLTGLRLLLKGLEEEARLSAFGRILIWNDVQRLLRYRLQLEDTRWRQPEIEEEKIEACRARAPLSSSTSSPSTHCSSASLSCPSYPRYKQAPVFILGLPRTGTTFLFNLLALDTSLFRSPLTWEVHHMHPPPDATCYDTDKRIGETEAFLEGVSALLPSFQVGGAAVCSLCRSPLTWEVHHLHRTLPRMPPVMTRTNASGIEFLRRYCLASRDSNRATGVHGTHDVSGGVVGMYDFTSFAFPTIHFNIPSYFRWYLSSDLTPT
ncbi:unnamed protein product, partial [Closterium sp. NIES-65]